MMKPEQLDSQTLNNQLMEWHKQIALLEANEEAALLAARQYALELEEIKAKYHTLAQQLHQYECHKNGSYMWENIGDGG